MSPVTGQYLQMNIFDSIFLGIVQGLTEFLPVSSSGHLVIASELLGLKANLAFVVAIHFATILAVLIYFFNDIILLITNFFKGLFDLATGKSKIKNVYGEKYFRLSLLIIVGSIPTAVIALLFKDWLESLFSSVFAVGCFLIVTGCLLLLAEKLSVPKKSEKQMTMLDSIIIGVFQGLAVAPGLSRSGSTVSASLLRGLNRELAARFSFLLSIPAVLGATLYELKDIVDLSFKDIGMVSILSGIIAAFISGYFAVKVFIDMIKRKKISIFAYYCFIVGAIVILKTFIS